MSMKTRYHFEKFIQPTPSRALSSGQQSRYCNRSFDRHTFNPKSKQQSNTLASLRKMGGKRWFHFSWKIWNGEDPDDFNSRSPALRQAVKEFPQKFQKQSCWGAPLVIDAGCGDSADIDVLHHNDIKAIGYDLFPRQMERTYEHYSISGKPPITVKRKSHFEIQDICEPWSVEENSVDVVLCNAVIDLLNFEERKLFYLEAFKRLKSGGFLAQYAIGLKNGHGHNALAEMQRMEEVGFKTFIVNGITFAEKI